MFHPMVLKKSHGLEMFGTSFKPANPNHGRDVRPLHVTPPDAGHMVPGPGHTAGSGHGGFLVPKHTGQW